MSERKVLNKYYPPDFDPSKIPRMKLPKNRQYTVRLMAPFNMRCSTCGEYIYKGKKFNARKEDVENSDYLGIRIYRFYIKCTRCLAEISFKTDPRNTDYEIEAGATRNFMALKLAEEQAVREEEERKEEESTNPMKLLENRTKASKQEIELMESLEELRDLNRRHRAVDHDTMLAQYSEDSRTREEREKAEDEAEIRSCFKSSSSGVKVLEEEIVEVDECAQPRAKVSRLSEPITKSATPKQVTKPVGLITLKSSAPVVPKPGNPARLGLLVRKKTDPPSTPASTAVTPKPAVQSSSTVTSDNKPMGLSSLCSYSSSDSD
ncbi:hypothetical protein B566_EDAN010141 [Ephemera danica]|nr:hypothetical protein B566_EDAN010141 [Ephemera danica]